MVTHELLLQKIKEQINEAESLVNDPILFKETLKRIELLCELVTEDDSKQEPATETKYEQQKVTNQVLKSDPLKSSDLTGDSIFDF